MMGFKFEPALLSEAVRQIVLALVLFGILNWDDKQIAGLMMALSGILAVFTRQTSIPVATVEDAGTSAGQLKVQAAAGRAAVAADVAAVAADVAAADVKARKRSERP